MNRLRRLALPIVAAVAAAALVSAGIAAATTSSGPGIIACPDGAHLTVDLAPDGTGTWVCGPAPTPTGSSTPTPSVTTPAPTTVPPSSTTPAPTSSTPKPTTPAPTTPAPTTPAPTTPAPSPSPTSTATGCLALPSACGFPDATNTGAHGPLAVVNGDVTLNTAGQVYEGKDVRGCINVTAPNVTIRNVKVTCGGDPGIDYAPGSTSAGWLTIQDSTVVCTNPYATGIGEWQFTAQRVNVSGCTNGFDVDRDVTIVDTWCHDLTPEIGPGSPGGDIHTDCVQGIQTDDVTIRHNTLITPFYGTSAIGGCCGISQRLRWVIENNLLDGGAYTLYCLNSGTDVGSRVTGNRFGPGGWNHSYADACNKPGLVWSGNVRDATGAALAAT